MIETNNSHKIISQRMLFFHKYENIYYFSDKLIVKKVLIIYSPFITNIRKSFQESTEVDVVFRS